MSDWWRRYLGDPSIKALYDYFVVRAGRPEWVSENTLRSYIEHVKDFSESQGYDSPNSLLKDVKAGKDLGPMLRDWVRYMIEGRRAPSSIQRGFSSIKRWLSCNGVEYRWEDVNLPRKRGVVEDRIPSKEELRKLLSYANPQLKAVISILCSSGTRVGSLVKLKVGDVDFNYDPEIALIKVPPEASKAGVGYYAFITPEAKTFLKEYLEYRRGLGETITRESPLISSGKKRGEPASYQSIQLAYTRLLKRLDMKEKKVFHTLHLHVLRKWFRTQVEEVLTKSYRERLMGHLGDYLDGSYFRPPEAEMREAYRRAIPKLTITEEVSMEEQMKRQALSLIRMIPGFTEEKLKRFEELLARTKNVEEAVEEFKKQTKRWRLMEEG